jgi:hypothetical protein
VHVRATLFILAVGVLAAFAARQFVTGWSGLTFTGQLQTGYVPFNIVAFWLAIGATVVVVVLRWLAR